MDCRPDPTSAGSHENIHITFDRKIESEQRILNFQLDSFYTEVYVLLELSELIETALRFKIPRSEIESEYNKVLGMIESENYLEYTLAQLYRRLTILTGALDEKLILDAKHALVHTRLLLASILGVSE